MAWNGQNDNGGDWGGKKPQSPPNLDKILSDFWQKLCRFFMGKRNGTPWQPTGNHDIGFAAGAVAVILFVLWLLSGLFIVNPAEQAVILRFGKFSDVLSPGLHWFARFIDTKYLVDVQKIYSFSIQGDFLTKSAEQSDLPNQYIPTSTDIKKGSVSLDQSKNLVNVELNVQYRIRDPRAYLFAVVDPDETIKQAASGSVSAAVGKMKLDEVLTTGREILSLGVLDQIKQVILPYDTGLEVLAVTLRKVQAPDQVRAAFSDVNRADQDKATLIQQAQAYASKVVPIAQGVAARTLAGANGYQQQVVLNAQADIAKYQALLGVYAVSPEVTRLRMYFDTMQTVLQNTTKMLVDVNAGNNLIYLPLDKLLQEKSAQFAAGAPVPQNSPVTLPNNIGSGE